MSKKDKKPTSPERLVLALIENAHFDEALVLLDELEKDNQLAPTPRLYARALATFAVGTPEKANQILHQAFACNNFVLPLMVSRVNSVTGKKVTVKNARLPDLQHQAQKYVDLWFGSWIQNENAFDWLGNQFVEWTRTNKLERLKEQQEKMLVNAKKLDIDFFLN